MRKIIIPNLESWTFKSILMTNNEYGRKLIYIKENERIYEVNLYDLKCIPFIHSKSD